MKLLLKSHTGQLLANGRANHDRLMNAQDPVDFRPVVKLVTPDANCTWLLSELDPEDPDIAFGLCDLGLGTPELGSVRITEIENLRGPFGLRAERDHFFKAEKSLNAYAAEARDRGHIAA